jgi:hypothetical protein
MPSRPGLPGALVNWLTRQKISLSCIIFSIKKPAYLAIERAENDKGQQISQPSKDVFSGVLCTCYMANSPRIETKKPAVIAQSGLCVWACLPSKKCACYSATRPGH